MPATHSMITGSGDACSASAVPRRSASTGHLADLRTKVEKAKRLRGLRLITLLIPCLDGWGLADDSALRTARHAVECGAYPLYEIEDGQRYTLNVTQRTRPVSQYLALQRRYRHMSEQDTQQLQAEIDEGWARLEQRVTASAQA